MRSSERVAVVVAATESVPAAPEAIGRFVEEVGGRGEVILVDGSRDGTSSASTRPRAGLRVLRRPPGSLAPELWRDGLDATDAPLVAFSTAAMVPAPGWLGALVEELGKTGASAVGGPIIPAARLSRTDRAVFLLRYANYLPPLHGPHQVEPPGDNALYRRDRLRGLESLIADGFWESEIHRRLQDGGDSLTMADRASVVYHGGVRLGPVLRQRYRHARRYGAERGERLSWLWRKARATAAPLVPTVLAARVVARLWSRREPVGPWIPAVPVLALLAVVWAAGEASGLWRGPTRARDGWPTGGRSERRWAAEGQGGEA